MRVIRYKGYIYGLLLSLAMAYMANVLHFHFPILESVAWGIIIGISLNNVIEIPASFRPGLSFSTKTLLNIGIIFLGAKLDFISIASLGPKILAIVSIVVISVMIISYLLSKSNYISLKANILLGVGSSVCGAAAVLAMAPVIKADKEESTFTAATTSILGGLGVIIYSLIARLNVLNDIEYGIWAGSSLQGVSHAVAAAFARNEISGNIGTVVKMARVLFLVPMALILGSVFNDKRVTTREINFPYYILGFIFIGLLNTAHVIPLYLIDFMNWTSQFFILMSVSSMATGVKIKDMMGDGLPILISGLIIFLCSSLISMSLIKLFGI
ncbi:MAG: putative sulfate exporter family transporter [Thermoanaerobacteraceae bacterium]|nr:putative sulfate exporter family transporter [Thermoanaerobacteraceae bacterium]